jgi:hypothetical protein
MTTFVGRTGVERRRNPKLFKKLWQPIIAAEQEGNQNRNRKLPDVFTDDEWPGKKPLPLRPLFGGTECLRYFQRITGLELRPVAHDNDG